MSDIAAPVEERKAEAGGGSIEPTHADVAVAGDGESKSETADEGPAVAVLALGSQRALARYRQTAAPEATASASGTAYPGEDASAQEDAYVGPPIGSIAKTAWPELVGTGG
jgi:hypothetical protein